MGIILTGGSIITPDQVLPDHDLEIENDVIKVISKERLSKQKGDFVLDVHSFWVLPGMIDLHIHGSLGSDTMDATPEALHTMASYLAVHGVSAYYPTTMAGTQNAINIAINNVKNTSQPVNGAQHLGVHLEGPYLNTSHKGAQPASYLREPNPDEYSEWINSGVVKLITVAPEIPGMMDFIEQGIRQGIEFAVGHSNASYEQVVEAAEHGLRQATHTYNGMLGLHHRAPGTVGGVMMDDRIYAQVIADGVHVHPQMIRILLRIKGIERVILISDAIRAAGLRDGDYDLGGENVHVNNGIARNSDGNLAGSTLTLDQAVRFVVTNCGVPLQRAIQMATLTPAKAMGLRKGRLKETYDADITVMDSDLKVRMTIISGRIVYNKL